MLDDAHEIVQQLSEPTPPSESLGKRIIAFAFTFGAVAVALYAVFAYGVLVDTVVELGNSVHPLMKLVFAQVRASLTGISSSSTSATSTIQPTQLEAFHSRRIGLSP